MPASCSHCGAAIGPGMRACQFCGTPDEGAGPEAETSVAEAPQPDSPGAPSGHKVDLGPTSEAPSELLTDSSPATAPNPAPASSPLAPVEAHAGAVPSRRLLTAAAAIVIGLVGVVIIYFMVGRFLSGFSALNGPAPALPAAGSGSTTPSSASSSSAVAATGLGVDLYPGAHPLSDPDRIDSSDRTVVSQSFVTTDKMDFVINYYKARMVGYTSIYASGNGVVVSINPGPQDFVLVAIAPAATAGQTRISITHTITKPGN